MQIVWDQAAVQRLKNSHTILELETFDVKGSPVTAFCVVPAEKIGLSGFATLERYKGLHTAFVAAYYDEDYKLCKDIAEHLMGQFGGELDTFYEEILSRINNKT
jgi:hypothetical protein